jgi:hypothetical protein
VACDDRLTDLIRNARTSARLGMPSFAYALARWLLTVFTSTPSRSAMWPAAVVGGQQHHLPFPGGEQLGHLVVDPTAGCGRWRTASGLPPSGRVGAGPAAPRAGTSGRRPPRPRRPAGRAPGVRRLPQRGPAARRRLGRGPAGQRERLREGCGQPGGERVQAPAVDPAAGRAPRWRLGAPPVHRRQVRPCVHTRPAGRGPHDPGHTYRRLRPRLFPT